MTDEQLIQQARDLHYQDWQGVDILIELAKSEETKNELKRISRRYYHNEEFANGDL